MVAAFSWAILSHRSYSSGALSRSMIACSAGGVSWGVSGRWSILSPIRSYTWLAIWSMSSGGVVPSGGAVAPWPPVWPADGAGAAWPAAAWPPRLGARCHASCCGGVSRCRPGWRVRQRVLGRRRGRAGPGRGRPGRRGGAVARIGRPAGVRGRARVGHPETGQRDAQVARTPRARGARRRLGRAAQAGPRIGRVAGLDGAVIVSHAETSTPFVRVARMTASECASSMVFVASWNGPSEGTSPGSGISSRSAR